VTQTDEAPQLCTRQVLLRFSRKTVPWLYIQEYVFTESGIHNQGVTEAVNWHLNMMGGWKMWRWKRQPSWGRCTYVVRRVLRLSCRMLLIMGRMFRDLVYDQGPYAEIFHYFMIFMTEVPEFYDFLWPFYAEGQHCFGNCTSGTSEMSDLTYNQW
jgi:hypothetical protein